MKPTTYLITYISFFDNKLEQPVVISNDSKLEVAKVFLEQNQKWEPETTSSFDSLEALQDECFNCGSAISVIEVE